ncbi:Ig-like domain-containing protein [Candidatus Saccharibacteria bacterium]|nr:Ig-like domain-containing protein [Candidatus Saccharibacteria bacterium]
MRKTTTVLFAITMMLSFSLFTIGGTQNAYAGDACDIVNVDDPLICGTPNSNEEAALQGTVKSVLEMVYTWIGIIAVIVIVIGGIRYMTSTGEAEKIKGAKSTIIYATIGLVVTLAAFAITEFVIDALEGREPGETIADGGGGSTESDTVEIKSISVLSSTRVYVGDSVKLKVKIVPDYATNRTISWKSSNTSVAMVSNNGEVKTKKEGTATITAKTSNGKTATSKITVIKEPEGGKSSGSGGKVTDPDAGVTSITAKETSISVEKGKTTTVKVTVKPNNAKNKTINWESKDKTIATVDSRGIIIGMKVGKTKIIASSANGKTVKIKVTVTDYGGDGEPIKVTDELLKKLKYYHQGQYGSTNYKVSCLNPRFSGVGNVSCGLSTYMAGAYALTRNKIDYMTFAREACKTHFFNGSGASWEVVDRSSLKRDKYRKKYGVKGKHIANTWSSVVSELKEGHPVAYMVSHGATTNGNGHFILLLSYRKKKDGTAQVYIWNPNQMAEGWHDRAFIEANVINRLRNDPQCLPWAMSKYKKD